MGAGGIGGGGGGKGGGGVSGPGGLSNADVALAGQALGQNIQAIHNRYQQLGLGTPASGQSPAAAAAGGTNLTYGGPSTMERMDVAGAQDAANALTGELFNPTNAAGLGAGGPLEQLAQQQQQDQQAGFAAGSGGGFGSNVNTTG